MSNFDADQDQKEVDTPKLRGDAEDPETQAMQDLRMRLNLNGTVLTTTDSTLLSTEKK